jgi:hypothetical protein
MKKKNKLHLKSYCFSKFGEVENSYNKVFSTMNNHLNFH